MTSVVGSPPGRTDGGTEPFSRFPPVPLAFACADEVSSMSCLDDISPHRAFGREGRFLPCSMRQEDGGELTEADNFLCQTKRQLNM